MFRAHTTSRRVWFTAMYILVTKFCAAMLARVAYPLTLVCRQETVLCAESIRAGERVNRRLEKEWCPQRCENHPPARAITSERVGDTGCVLKSQSNADSTACRAPDPSGQASYGIERPIQPHERPPLFLDITATCSRCQLILTTSGNPFETLTGTLATCGTLCKHIETSPFSHRTR
jgi:hypothetical protein